MSGGQAWHRPGMGARGRRAWWQDLQVTSLPLSAWVGGLERGWNQVSNQSQRPCCSSQLSEILRAARSGAVSRCLLCRTGSMSLELSMSNMESLYGRGCASLMPTAWPED